ncbi:class I SAM-dependent methyltransferase [Candidatus Riflebacteria bacterium]
MDKKKPWEEFFDGHAPEYMDNCFTKNTVAEVEFLFKELELKPGSSILDLGCGTGRHAIELAKKGFSVTGVDLSSGMLAEAQKAADSAGVHVDWKKADARSFTSEKIFDAAICLCEGAFGLLEHGEDPIEHPLSILRNINCVLKPKAKAIFTVLNAMAMIRQHKREDVRLNRFDPLTMSMVSECLAIKGGAATQMRERGFVPTELTLLFRQADLEVLHIWGGTAGNWGRREIDLDEIEIMLVAQKIVDS